MKVAIACGGTGGHIFPGLAVGDVLTGKGHDVTIWLAGKDIESEALNEWQGKVVTVSSRGFQGRNLFSHIKTAYTLMKVTAQCRKKMKTATPDILLAMGSYASIGPARAAHALRIPLILHEANVIPGRAISLLSRYADCVAVSFEETRYHLRRKGVDVTGMPLRSNLQAAAQQSEKKGMNEDFRLMVMGGSRGARKLNEVCSEAICSLMGDRRDFEVVHLTGSKDEDEIRSKYETAGVPHSVHAFYHDMADIYLKTDMAICRAGASTCAEVNAFAIPALLVPYPYAAKQHQMANAEAMERRGCADVIAEDNLNANWLAEFINESIADKERLARMRENAVRHSLHSGAEALANLVEKKQADLGDG